jgi:hypothetical protein
MGINEPLRPGEPVEWIGAEYTEDGVGTVREGTRGLFITTDGESEDDGVVVSFDPLGAFCCRRTDIRRPDGA